MSKVPPSPLGRIVPRHAAVTIESALEDTRVVLANGARQSGKSTLAAKIGERRGADWRSLDRDPQPGRFLLTGSARVLGLRGVPDALPGRMETVELWPLSQG